MAPMKPSTGWPALKAKTVGMDWMRSCWAISGFSSILTFTSFTAPPAASTAASSAGPSVLQGPHQGAQKSTITGTVRLASSTSAAKVARPESLMCGLAPLAAFWAGWEVTGRPPGPINAMRDIFRSFRSGRWSFRSGNGRAGYPPLPQPQGRGDAQFHDQRDNDRKAPGAQPGRCQGPGQPAQHHQPGQQAEGMATGFDGGDQRPETQPQAQQQPAEIGGMGEGMRRPRQFEQFWPQRPQRAGQHRHQPGDGNRGLQQALFAQGTSFLIHCGSAKAAAWTSGL